MKPLRDYQKLINDQLTTLDGRNVCVQMPTGVGKSNNLVHQVDRLVNAGERCLVIVPKRELTHNILNQLGDDYGSIAYAGVQPNLTKPVLIATPITAGYHAAKFKPTRLFSDECHKVASDKWGSLALRLRVPHVGFTATPNRLDGKGLYPWFGKLLQSYSIKWFIENGYLSPYELVYGKAVTFESSTGTDDLGKQERLLIPEIESSLNLWEEHAACKKTLVFAATIKHAELMCEAFIQRGYSAAVLHSKNCNSERRDNIFNAYKQGKIQVLINIDFFTEGVDVPEVDCVMLCRFTYSTARFLQMAGRGLRYVPGKTLKIIDFVNNCFYHGAPDAPFYWSLEGQDKQPRNTQESLLYSCARCREKLAVKAVIKHSPVYVSCLKCMAENILILQIKDKNNGSKLHETFDIEMLHKLEDSAITELTRILQSREKKWNTVQKKMMAIMGLKIGKDYKIKALKAIGLDDKTIALYYD